MRVPVLLALTLLSTNSLFAQAPKETTDDPNKQQVVPKLADIPQPARGFGTVVGQFVFEGAIPEKALLHKAGDAAVKDGETCAAKDHFKNDLVINAKNKGIADIFFYEKAGTYKKKPDAIHPALRVPAKKQLFFDQKGCRFFPKSLLVHALPNGAGQKVTVLSNDPVNHNTHTSSIKNTAVNFLVGANDREGTDVKLSKPETVPMGVKCDLHPWMKANWLVMDHPYMAVSNKDGRFMIANLPAGKHEFRLWHTNPGYVHKKLKDMKGEGFEVKKKKFFVEIKDGKVANLGQIKLKADIFKSK